MLGFDEPSRAVVGLAHPERDKERLKLALQMIQPHLRLEPEIIQLDGKPLLVLQVPQGSRFPYAAGGRVVQRAGERVVPLTADQILRRVSVSGAPIELEERRLAEAIEAQGQKIDEQSARIEELTESASVRAQLPVQMAFLLAGLVLGYLIGGWNPLGF